MITTGKGILLIFHPFLETKLGSFVQELEEIQGFEWVWGHTSINKFCIINTMNRYIKPTDILTAVFFLAYMRNKILHTWGHLLANMFSEEHKIFIRQVLWVFENNLG